MNQREERKGRLPTILLVTAPAATQDDGSHRSITLNLHGKICGFERTIQKRSGQTMKLRFAKQGREQNPSANTHAARPAAKPKKDGMRSAVGRHEHREPQEHERSYDRKRSPWAALPHRGLSQRSGTTAKNEMAMKTQCKPSFSN